MRNLFNITIVVVFIISCQNKSDKNLQEQILLLDSYAILSDSLSNAWDIMIADDDEKHKYMKRLLNEVSYSGSFDEKRHEELTIMVDELAASRYDQQTMSRSAHIDEYDSATNEVSRQVIDFAYNHPSYNESELMKEIVKDINYKNQMILHLRIDYDAFADELNAIIEQHSGLLDSTFRDELWPVFRLPMDEI